jgi:hypothetical protein
MREDATVVRILLETPFGVTYTQFGIVLRNRNKR